MGGKDWGGGQKTVVRRNLKKRAECDGDPSLRYKCEGRAVPGLLASPSRSTSEF